MRADQVRLLFDYNYWANGRILDAVEKLSFEQYNANVPGVSHGSVRATLVHALAAEQIWRRRCLEGVSPTTLLQEADFPTLEALHALWKVEEAAMRAGLALLTEEALGSPLDYRTTNGSPKKETLWQLLTHLINHGTQHRAEVAVALTAFGHSPGDVDMIIYFRQR